MGNKTPPSHTHTHVQASKQTHMEGQLSGWLAHTIGASMFLQNKCSAMCMHTYASAHHWLPLLDTGAKHIVQTTRRARHQRDGKQNDEQHQRPRQHRAAVALTPGHPQVRPVDLLWPWGRVYLELGRVLSIDAGAGCHCGCSLALEQHKPAGREGAIECLASSLGDAALQVCNACLYHGVWV